jgi:hypothetical protein
VFRKLFAISFVSFPRRLKASVLWKGRAGKISLGWEVPLTGRVLTYLAGQWAHNEQFLEVRREKELELLHGSRAICIHTQCVNLQDSQ